jgi:hypothetical protein
VVVGLVFGSDRGLGEHGKIRSISY